MLKRCLVWWSCFSGLCSVAQAQLLPYRVKTDFALYWFSERPPNRMKLWNDTVANVLENDSLGETTLHLAARMGDTVLLGLLKGRGGNLNEVNKKGESAAHLSTYSNEWEAFLWLIRNGADPNSKDKRGTNLVARCMQTNHPDELEALIRAGAIPSQVDAKGRSLLQWALEKGNLTLADLLLSKNARWQTPQLTATSPAVLIVRLGAVKLYNHLRKQGLDPAQPDVDGNHLAHHAAEAEQAEMVTLLLNTTAGPNPRNRAGETPLHWAARTNNESVIRKMLEAAADPKLTDNLGRTPLMVAALKGKRYAVEALMPVSEVNLSDRQGNTALHHAATAGDIACIEKLLAAGAKATAKNKDGNTPLELAANEQVQQRLGGKASRTKTN